MANPAGPAPTAYPGPVPTPQQVHELMPQRAPFTPTSKPSIADVQKTIETIADGFYAEFPGLPLRLRPTAVAYLRFSAASLLEATYNPEQQFGDNSPAAIYDQRAGALLLILRNAPDSVQSRVGKRLGTVEMLPAEYETAGFVSSWG